MPIIPQLKKKKKNGEKNLSEAFMWLVIKLDFGSHAEIYWTDGSSFWKKTCSTSFSLHRSKLIVRPLWALTEVGGVQTSVRRGLGVPLRELGSGVNVTIRSMCEEEWAFYIPASFSKISCFFPRHIVLNRTFISLLWDSDSQGSKRGWKPNT